MPLTRTLAYADVEALLTSWLQGQLGQQARLVTEVPADLSFAAGTPQAIVHVVRIGGARRFTFDNATVDIECFAPTRSTARKMADQVGLLLEQALPGQQVGPGSVGAVICTAGPSWLPWDDTAVRRFGATYQVNVHAAQ